MLHSWQRRSSCVSVGRCHQTAHHLTVRRRPLTRQGGPTAPSSSTRCFFQQNFAVFSGEGLKTATPCWFSHPPGLQTTTTRPRMGCLSGSTSRQQHPPVPLAASRGVQSHERVPGQDNPG